MQEFKVGDHVIVDGGTGHYLDDGLDGVVIFASGSLVIVEGYSTYHGWRPVEQYVRPADLIKVDDLVTFPEPVFAVGDRAIVVGNTDRPSGITHFIEVGTDVEIIGGPEINDGRVLYEVSGYRAESDLTISQRVAACDLEAEPTYPRRSWWVDYSPADYKADLTIDYALTPAATVALDDNLVRRYLALHGATELLGTSRDVDELTAVADWLLGDAA